MGKNPSVKAAGKGEVFSTRSPAPGMLSIGVAGLVGMLSIGIIGLFIVMAALLKVGGCGCGV